MDVTRTEGEEPIQAREQEPQGVKEVKKAGVGKVADEGVGDEQNGGTTMDEAVGADDGAKVVEGVDNCEPGNLAGNSKADDGTGVKSGEGAQRARAISAQPDQCLDEDVVQVPMESKKDR